MTAPTTLQRAAGLRRLHDLLRADAQLHGVELRLGPPRADDGVKGRLISLERFVGQVTRPHLRAGRKAREDRAQLEVWCHAHTSGDQPWLALEQAEALAARVESLLADDPQLAAGGDALAGLVSAVVDDLEGPNAIKVEDGWASFARVVVAFTFRLT